jgi:hypothetical protein
MNPWRLDGSVVMRILAVQMPLTKTQETLAKA